MWETETTVVTHREIITLAARVVLRGRNAGRASRRFSPSWHHSQCASVSLG